MAVGQVSRTEFIPFYSGKRIAVVLAFPAADFSRDACTATKFSFSKSSVPFCRWFLVNFKEEGLCHFGIRRYPNSFTV